jgi:Protein of unknown function (DUF1116)
VRAEVLEHVEAVNVGLPEFAYALLEQGATVVEVDWRPPAAGAPELLPALERLWGRHGARVARANEEAVERIESAVPRAIGVARAGDALSVLEGRALLHAGPPINFERICDPQRRALVAACLFEGWAEDRDEAADLLARGAIALHPGNPHNHVGAMTGACSPSMPVWVVEDEVSGTRAYSTFNEGPGNTLWFGVGDDESIERLRFFRDELGPLVARLIGREGPIDIFDLVAQGLQMGDELHMRSQATGNLLIRRLLPGFAALGGERAARFVSGNHHFFLSLTMAAAKCASLAAAGVAGSSIVNVISRNGTDMGLQVAGLPGRWFTAPAAPVREALLREGHTEEDGALDIGDSAVIECIGLGGMAIGASPAVAGFFGGRAQDAFERTELMSQITLARSRRFAIPALDMAGAPLGIDARLVTELEVTPQITTGVLHGSSGAGQIGAGVAHQPIEPFRAAVLALAAELDGPPAATARGPRR